MIYPDATPTPVPPSLGRRILMFPLTRILIVSIWAVFAFGLASVPLIKATGPLALFRDMLACAAAYGVYVFFVRQVEQRQPTELAVAPAAKETALGFTWGLSLFSLVIAVLAALGLYRITGHNGVGVLWAIGAVTVQSGFLEELMMRAILFRISEEGLGTIGALLLSSLVFGFMHAANPGATLISSLFIAIEAGTLLAAAYLWRRRLWLAIGLHMGWNFAQGGIWGVPVSGQPMPGLLVGKLTGPALVTGGRFGPEAGIVALVICLAGFFYFLHLSLKQEPLRVPAWMRRPSHS